MVVLKSIYDTVPIKSNRDTTIYSDVGAIILGEIVENGNVEDIYNNPQHEYTKALLASIPIPNPNGRQGRKLNRLKIKKYNI